MPIREMTNPAIASPLGRFVTPTAEKIRPSTHKIQPNTGIQPRKSVTRARMNPAVPIPFERFSTCWMMTVC